MTTTNDRQAQADAQRHQDEAARILTLRAIQIERNAGKRQDAGQLEQGTAFRLRKVAGLRPQAAW